MTARRVLRLAIGAALLCGSAPTLAANAAEADLSGVWWIRDRGQVASMDHDTLPFLPAAAAVYARNRAAAARGEHVPIGQYACIPEGTPRLMLARYPIQILQRPEQVTILHERMHMFRLIYLNKPHKADADPSYNGDSTGTWDGDTLVVDTTAFNDRTVMDATGIPHSDALHLIERLSLADGGQTLRDVVTVEDPKTFSRTWTFVIEFAKRPDIRLMEDVCTFGPPRRDSQAGGRR